MVPVVGAIETRKSRPPPTHVTPSPGVRCDMAVQRKSTKPVGITNSSGQPEIVLEIDGLTISMTPPGTAPAPPPTDGGESDSEEA